MHFSGSHQIGRKIYCYISWRAMHGDENVHDVKQILSHAFYISGSVHSHAHARESLEQHAVARAGGATARGARFLTRDAGRGIHETEEYKMPPHIHLSVSPLAPNLPFVTLHERVHLLLERGGGTHTRQTGA